MTKIWHKRQKELNIKNELLPYPHLPAFSGPISSILILESNNFFYHTLDTDLFSAISFSQTWSWPLISPSVAPHSPCACLVSQLLMRGSLPCLPVRKMCLPLPLNYMKWLHQLKGGSAVLHCGGAHRSHEDRQDDDII